MRSLLRRSLWLVLGALGCFGALLAPAWSQAPIEIAPAKAVQLLELLSDPEIRSWLEGQTQPAPAVPPSGESIAAGIADWESTIRTRIGALGAALLRMPEEISSAVGTVSRDVNSGRPGLVTGILALLFAIGLGVEWLVRTRFARAMPVGHRTDAGRMAISELVALLAFSAASIGVFLAFDWPPLLHRVVLVLLIAVIAFRLTFALARLPLLAMAGSGDPAVDTSGRMVERPMR